MSATRRRPAPTLHRHARFVGLPGSYGSLGAWDFAQCPRSGALRLTDDQGFVTGQMRLLTVPSKNCVWRKTPMFDSRSASVTPRSRTNTPRESDPSRTNSARISWRRSQDLSEALTAHESQVDARPRFIYTSKAARPLVSPKPRHPSTPGRTTSRRGTTGRQPLMTLRIFATTGGFNPTSSSLRIGMSTDPNASKSACDSQMSKT
jgi:hypothetical protein